MEGGYENPWYYKGTAFTSDDIGDFFGYVYLITNKSTGKKYIGRKYFVQRVNQREESVELLLSQIGRSIMEAPQNSKPTYPDMERTTSPERSYPSTKPWER